MSLGPVSILFSLSAGAHQLVTASNILHVLSSILVMTSAFLAGLLFRPDNSAVLELLSPLLDMVGLGARLSYRDGTQCSDTSVLTTHCRMWFNIRPKL